MDELRGLEAVQLQEVLDAGEGLVGLGLGVVLLKGLHHDLEALVQVGEEGWRAAFLEFKIKI